MYSRQDPALETFKCTYSHQKMKEGQSPHFHKGFQYERKLVYDDILDVIGNTPMVKLNKIPQEEGVKCNIYAKCEFLNPGGSLKDRIGQRMVSDAEQSGRIKKGHTLIEATSGNTGIGLAMAAAIRGYNCHITLPEKMSTEKTDVLNALGAKIHRTPTEAAFDDPESHISKAIQLQKSINDSHILDQYINPGNTIAHYDGTGEEIIHQLQGKVDYIFVGAGTGGTITGIGRRIREKAPGCKIVGVDPHGSILAQPQSLNTRDEAYLMEGIGYDFVPRVLDRNFVDHWIKIDDHMALPMTRRIIRGEGMLCGGSSGGVLAAAIQYCKENNLEGKNIVVIFADNIRNYLTKLVSDEWMVEKRFYPFEKLSVYENSRIAKSSKDDIKLTEIQAFHQTTRIGDLIQYFKEHNFPQIPLLDKSEKFVSVVTQNKVVELVLNKSLSQEDVAQKIQTKDYSLFNYEEITIHGLAQLLSKRPCVFLKKVVDTKEKYFIVTPSSIFDQLF